MEFKKINVYEWHRSQRVMSDLGLEEGLIDYSLEKRDELINLILSKGYKVMLNPKPKEETLVIYISDDLFRQR